MVEGEVVLSFLLAPKQLTLGEKLFLRLTPVNTSVIESLREVALPALCDRHRHISAIISHIPISRHSFPQRPLYAGM
jgi:hypothetical protein